MNLRPSLAWLCAALASAVASAWVIPAARAGLSEATDFHGPWATGSVLSNGSSFPGGWSEETDVTADDTDALVSQLGGTNGELTWIETQITGPTTLHYSYRVINFDAGYSWIEGRLNLLVGGTETLICGSTDSACRDSGWQEATASIPSGVQTVRWQLSYYRGKSNVRAYLDQVWTSDDPRPRMASIREQIGRLGDPLSVTIPVSSSTPVTLTAIGLPPGVTADPNAFIISGTPTDGGRPFEATLTATNAAGRHSTKLRFYIQLPLTSLPSAVEAPSLVFTEGDGAGSWGGVTGVSFDGAAGFDGVDSAQATLVTSDRDISQGPYPRQLSTRLIGPGTLRFWFRNYADWGASASDFTKLVVTSTPIPLSTLLDSGATTWTRAELPIAPGPQIITWNAWRITQPGPTAYPALFINVDSVGFTPKGIPPQPTFAAWTAAWALSDPSPTSDPDEDGVPLLMEYAIGANPYHRNPKLPFVATIVDDHPTLRVTKAASPTDLRITVQGSTDLRPESWSTDSVELLEEDSTHLLVRSKKPVPEQPSFHLRVHVLLVP